MRAWPNARGWRGRRCGGRRSWSARSVQRYDAVPARAWPAAQTAERARARRRQERTPASCDLVGGHTEMSSPPRAPRPRRARAAACRRARRRTAHRSRILRGARTPVCDEYTLKQQMEAYVKMLRETGASHAGAGGDAGGDRGGGRLGARADGHQVRVERRRVGRRRRRPAGPAPPPPPPRRRPSRRSSAAGTPSSARMRTSCRSTRSTRGPGSVRRRPVERRRRAPARRPAPRRTGDEEKIEALNRPRVADTSENQNRPPRTASGVSSR